LKEKKIFRKIKLSYLIVGHTQEDVDALFSIISRFFKFVLKRVHTITAFINDLISSMKKAPKCVEQIEYCFDYSLLQQFADKNLAHFDLNEKSNDKCHCFVFWYDSSKGAVMQYKKKMILNTSTLSNCRPTRMLSRCFIPPKKALCQNQRLSVLHHSKKNSQRMQRKHLSTIFKT
jgi:hypothetical protein